jgi:hypothetical protein
MEGQGRANRAAWDLKVGAGARLLPHWGGGGQAAVEQQFQGEQMRASDGGGAGWSDGVGACPGLLLLGRVSWL